MTKRLLGLLLVSLTLGPSLPALAAGTPAAQVECRRSKRHRHAKHHKKAKAAPTASANAGAPTPKKGMEF